MLSVIASVTCCQTSYSVTQPHSSTLVLTALMTFFAGEWRGAGVDRITFQVPEYFPDRQLLVLAAAADRVEGIAYEGVQLVVVEPGEALSIDTSSLVAPAIAK